MTQRMMSQFVFIALISLASVGVLANGNTQIWNSPEQAVQHHNPIKNRVRNFERDGFELIEEFGNAYRYAVAPVGDYDWGVYLIKLKKSSGDYSLETTYVTITVYVRYLENADGYKVTGFDVHEETVY